MGQVYNIQMYCAQQCIQKNHKCLFFLKGLQPNALVCLCIQPSKYFYLRHDLDKVWNLADFILQNRRKMKFRIQEKKSIFYSNKELAFELKTKFIDHFVNMETVDPRHGELKENIVGCHRLPHGKYQYQVHIKKDAHRIITDLQRENLKNFIERNVDNCYVPSHALLDYLEDKCAYCFGGYFYVTQERYITPIYMMAQQAIDKIIKFRKVKNGSNQKTTR